MYQPSSLFGTYRKVVGPYGLTEYTTANIDPLSNVMMPTSTSDQSTQNCLPGRLHHDLNVIPTTDRNPLNSNNASDAPVISSVWLEQGEYFFDDEFSVPYDAQLQSAPSVGHTNCEAAAPTMTRSLVTELCSSESSHHLPSGPSHSASFFSTPADSCESGMASGQTQFADESPADDLRLQNSTPSFAVENQSSLKGEAELNRGDKDVHKLSTKTGNKSQVVDFNEDLDGSVNRAVTDGTSQRSFLNGSVGSCQTESNSWMQMMMERSCNPELKALLNRTAATAADYKLTFGDNLLNECSSFSDWSQRFGEVVAAHGNSGLGRSFSQGSMFDLNSFTGLRRALQQAGASLSKNQSTSESKNALGHPVGVDNSCNSTPATKSTDAKVDSTAVTTWAIKHGSRESLKRKSLRTSNASQLASEAAAISQKRVDYTSHSWQALKQASGTLMTWNQLKRTANSEKARENAIRESRPRSQTPRWSEGVDKEPDVMVEQRSCPDTSSSCYIRSRSQPVSSTDKHMHRFSGTLFEIFMRTRADDILSSDAASKIAVDKTTVIPPKPAQGVPLLSPSTVRIGNMNVPTSTAGHGRRSLESDKHPLLRGDRILPQRIHPMQFSPMSTSMIDSPRYLRNCGTQVPSVGPTSEPTVAYQTNTTLSPTWSNGASTQQSHKNAPSSSAIATCLTVSAGPDSRHFAAMRANYLAEGYPTGWLGNPRASIAYPGLGLLSVPRPSRLAGTAFLSNTLPDLSFLGQAAAEEERKGTPTMPKRSSLNANHNRSSTDDSDGCCCRKCGCRSVSTGRVIYKCRNSSHFQRHLQSLGCKKSAVPEASAGRFKVHSPQNPNPDAVGQVPDLVFGHSLASCATPQYQRGEKRTEKQDQWPTDYDQATFTNRSRPTKICQLDRSTSEPDLMSVATLRRQYHRRSRQKVPRLKAPLAAGEEDEPTSSTAAMQDSASTDLVESMRASVGGSLLYPGDDSDGDASYYPTDSQCALPWSFRPKKSVSFSGKVHLLQLQSSMNSPSSPEPRAIPRSWGLYGQVTPVAEFNTRTSPGRDNRSISDTSRPSDVDLRYHAMVTEVMKAVQETIAYFSTTAAAAVASGKQTGSRPATSAMSTGNSSPTSALPLPYTAVAALGCGSTGRVQSLIAVVSPLMVLLCDGLIPPSKPIFVSKPRTKLWQMVEESCRPSALLTGVALHVLTDALQQVKSLTNVASEKVKLKAFICACLNSKALPMWLNALVANDNLLRRFYCQDAFVRQCRSSQRGLHADLMTHIEQLLAFPFNIDVSGEARRPLIDPLVNGGSGSSTTASSTASSSVAPVVTAATTTVAKATGPSCQASTIARSSKVVPKTAPTKATVLPVGMMLRRGTPSGGQTAGPTRLAPVPQSATGPSIPHYPSHHLPGQRTSAPTGGGRMPKRPTPPPQRRVQKPSEILDDSTSTGESPSNASSIVSNEVRCRRAAAPTSSAGATARGRFRAGLFRRTAGQLPATLPDCGTNLTNTAAAGKATAVARRTDSESSAQTTVGKRVSTASGVVSRLKQPSALSHGTHR